MASDDRVVPDCKGWPGEDPGYGEEMDWAPILENVDTIVHLAHAST